jgi:DNA polymerase elongation subunit (family B)
MDDTKDALIFQVSSWFSADESYCGDEGDDACDKFLIKAFGCTIDGRSVSVNLLDFTPHFYIKITHRHDARYSQRLHEHVVTYLPAHLRNAFIGVKILKRKDFWGFTNFELFPFARLAFKSLSAMNAAVRIFEKDVKIIGYTPNAMRYKLYESNIEPLLRFMHIRNILPTGWVRIPANKYEKNIEILKSTCDIDINCSWKVIEPVEDVEKLAPFKVASFDLECTSSHGDFPMAKKNYQKVVNQLYDAFASQKQPKEVLQDELVAIFTPAGGRFLSRVFPKSPPKITSMTDLIERNMDDIMNILSGRIQYRASADKITRETIVRALVNKFDRIFPALEGDPIIQIGTTVHKYGEKSCYYRAIVTLGSCAPIEGVDVISCKTEAELLMAWRNVINQINPDMLIGYNIFGFDFAYLKDRADELGIERQFSMLGRIAGKSCEWKIKELSSSALGDNTLKFYETDGRVLIDIMKVIQRDHKLDSFKLDNVAHHFIGLNKNDVHPSDIFRLQKGSDEDRRVIAEYCIQDCTLCNQLTMKLEIIANNVGMSNVCSVPLTYIFMRGQGIKIFSLVAKECKNAEFLIPAPTKTWGRDVAIEADDDGYEGAIVLEPKCGIYIDDPVCVLDYASLYPSSMISENLSHDCIVIDKTYDNLPGYEYLDITYDIYQKTGDKKEKVGERVCRFAQLPNNEKGIIPSILMKLLRQRKETRKKIEWKVVTYEDGTVTRGLNIDPDKTVVTITDAYDDFEKAVLDGLQNAYKVTANSLYGQIGSRMSAIYLKDIAACTTATGRKMICMARDFLQTEYKANIVYGDSVASYTPTILNVEGHLIVMEICELANAYGDGHWVRCAHDDTKESCELDGTRVYVWTESGWTRIHRVIRHALAPTKRMIRVLTDIGVVDVTDDHSLVRADGSPCSTKDVCVGDALLHAPFPGCECKMKSLDIDEVKILGLLMDDESTIPTAILNASYEVRKAFWEWRLYKDGLEQRSQVGAQSLAILAESLGYVVSIDMTSQNLYKITLSEDTPANTNTIRIKKMYEIPYDGYVYDLTTANHHFAAGVGKLVVHNTDSVFAVFPTGKKGHEAIMPSIHTAMEASSKFKAFLKPPHDLEYEKIFYPFILLSKKRYVANKYEHDDKKCKQSSMGIVLKRRDNATIVKKIYGTIIDIILNKQDVKASIEFLKKSLQDLVDGKNPLEDLIITKSLRADYKDPEKIAHKVLADRIKERDPGNAPNTSDRIPYIYIETPATKKAVLQGERIETPDYIRANGIKPDYEFYITNQIMNPVLQVYALALEQIDGYRKTPDHWTQTYAKILKDRDGDVKKAQDKLQELREAEVKHLLFDSILNKLKNQKQGLRSITDFFGPKAI